LISSFEAGVFDRLFKFPLLLFSGLALFDPDIFSEQTEQRVCITGDIDLAKLFVQPFWSFLDL
jgi:hypothetical protein